MGNVSGKGMMGTPGSGECAQESPQRPPGTGVAQKPLTRETQHFTYVLAGAVSVVTFLLYLSSLQNGFVEWDDNLYVYRNPHIRSLDATFFRWAFFDFYGANWHPLTWISHALDYAIWGLNPLGHHLTSTILHSVNAFLVVLLIVRLLEANNPPSPPFIKGGNEEGERQQPIPPLEKGDKGGFSDKRVFIAAATTGLLFGLHPLHVESVAWVAERKDLLCGLFFLLSIMAYLRYATSLSGNHNSPLPPLSLRGGGPKARGRYLLSLGFFLLALLSKPMAVSLPVVLLILDWYPFKRIWSLRTLRSAFLEKLPFIALSLISSLLTLMAQQAVGAIKTAEAIPLTSRMLVAPQSLTAYLGKMMLPTNLLPFYPYPREVSLSSPEYSLPIALAIGITLFCLGVIRKQRLWAAVWGYYVVTLSPVLGIVQVGAQSMADRYTYLPSLGPFLLAGLWAAWALKKVDTLKKWGRFVALSGSCAIAIAFAFLSYLTFEQIAIWRNDMNLWGYVIKEEGERVPFAYNNLGIALEEKGRLDEAIVSYQKALSLNPRHAKAHNNLGNAYYKKGLLEDAVREYQAALSLDPGSRDTLYNLSVVSAMTSYKK